MHLRDGSGSGDDREASELWQLAVAAIIGHQERGFLAPGGTLIIASACSEGFGSPEFRAAQVRLAELGPERFLATLTAKSLAEVDEWQTEMQLKPMRVGRIQLYTTGLDAEERRITGVEIISNLDAAIAESIDRHDDPAVALIPEGPYVVPVHSERHA